MAIHRPLIRVSQAAIARRLARADRGAHAQTDCGRHIESAAGRSIIDGDGIRANRRTADNISIRTTEVPRHPGISRHRLRRRIDLHQAALAFRGVCVEPANLALLEGLREYLAVLIFDLPGDQLADANGARLHRRQLIGLLPQHSAIADLHIKVFRNCRVIEQQQHGILAVSEVPGVAAAVGRGLLILADLLHQSESRRAHRCHACEKGARRRVGLHDE